MDMWKGYISSTRKHVPAADEKICFDRFHVAKALGDALDILRRLRLRIARAWPIKEAAAKPWHYVRRGWAEKAWRKWIGWAMRSRIEPIERAAGTIRNHLWGIVNAVALASSTPPPSPSMRRSNA